MSFSLLKIILQSYKKYAVFNGRASRLEYWSFRLFLFVVQFLLAIFAAVMAEFLQYDFFQLSDLGLDFEPLPILFIISPTSGQIFYTNILTGLFSAFSLIPLFAVSVRRLHDIGKSGWFFLLSPDAFVIPLILLVSFIQVLFELFKFLSYAISLADLLSLIIIALFVLSWLSMFLLWLFFASRRGNEKENRFGNPPLK